ncbi:VOC family protein [Amycolatopsis sp. NPDC059657]|uniref:VOC family protein n=1 Tax=Amycolatopsis sp. NPDC059657 TaxID=3346899 RepID=UPI00367204EE
MPIPEGYHTVTPWIITRDSRQAMAFAARAFDAEEIAVVAMPDGSVGHAEMRIGDSVVMFFDSRPEWQDTPCFLRLYVEDGDATFKQALEAGATAVTEMTELFFGDKVGRVRDPLGNVWWIQERLEDLDEAEAMRRMAMPRYADAMDYVTSANVVPLR